MTRLGIHWFGSDTKRIWSMYEISPTIRWPASPRGKRVWPSELQERSNPGNPHLVVWFSGTENGNWIGSFAWWLQEKGEQSSATVSRCCGKRRLRLRVMIEKINANLFIIEIVSNYTTLFEHDQLYTYIGSYLCIIEFWTQNCVCYLFKIVDFWGKGSEIGLWNFGYIIGSFGLFCQRWLVNVQVLFLDKH